MHAKAGFHNMVENRYRKIFNNYVYGTQQGHNKSRKTKGDDQINRCPVEEANCLRKLIHRIRQIYLELSQHSVADLQK
jgi:hypothetical protein